MESGGKRGVPLPSGDGSLHYYIFIVLYPLYHTKPLLYPHTVQVVPGNATANNPGLVRPITRSGAAAGAANYIYAGVSST